MKRISVLIIASTFFFSSCNNDGDKKEEMKAADSTTTVSTTTVTPPAFVPYNVVVIEHKVKDFNKWQAAYLSHDSMRQVYGVSKYVTGREMPDSNMVVVIDKLSDVQKAKEFAASATLKDAMQKAGVSGAPKIYYRNIIRQDSSRIEQKDRVMVTHKVKDFDAWLKVFDAEGKAKRAEYGLIDRTISRGVDDPNMVTVVFAISDMEKAKARSNSPELKKLMTDAGVEGPPQITYYKIAALY